MAEIAAQVSADRIAGLSLEQIARAYPDLRFRLGEVNHFDRRAWTVVRRAFGAESETLYTVTGELSTVPPTHVEARVDMLPDVANKFPTSLAVGALATLPRRGYTQIG